MKYIIGKSSRNFITPYTGPTCKLANIKPGQLYNSFKEAQKDAEKLTKFNSVGFVVKVFQEKKN